MTRDLVLYLMLHLLTVQRMAGVLGRCQRAPALGDWQNRCNRLVPSDWSRPET
jgi:hypothetical protein